MHTCINPCTIRSTLLFPCVKYVCACIRPWNRISPNYTTRSPRTGSPLQAKGVLCAEAVTNIVCINANCLRAKRWGTFLGKLLENATAGICSVTEAHLRKDDLSRISFDNYVLLADYCRPTPGGEWIAGGVIILVHENFAAEAPPAISGLPRHLENCATKF